MPHPALSRAPSLPFPLVTPLLVALLSLAAACGDAPGSADSAPTIVDSAGIPVVHNPSGGLWGPGEGWTVERELRIGGAEAGPDLEFGQIVGVDIGAGGEIYVADMQARRIHVFDAIAELADHYPAFASLLVGPGGSLWVQRFRTGDDLAGAEGVFDPQDMGSSEWDVFDGEGGYFDLQSLVAYRLVR